MSIIKRTLIVAAAVATTAIAFAAFGPQKDIVTIASESKDFKTLVAAVRAAGLVEALKGDGPFTVFAPTDEAFQKLEKAKPGTLATLLKPENKKMLTDILTFHVVPGKVMASDVIKLANGTKVKTLNGASITVGTGRAVTVNGAKVVKTDIVASNGVIHVIDTVILPPSK